MKKKVPATIAEYIRLQSREAQPHLKRLRKILRSVAPEAQETIKWSVPFYITPRFLFSFSAFKTYCVFVPTPEALEAFRDEVDAFETTKNFLKLPYNKPVPEALIRKLAKYRMRNMGGRDSFW